jgi:hypothetical protein
MSGPSPRAAAYAFASLFVVVLLTVLLFAWPGFLTSDHCPSWGERTQLLNGGRSYCAETVSLNPSRPYCPRPYNGSWSPQWQEASFDRFSFHFVNSVCGLVGGVTVVVSDPNGTIYFGGTGCGGPAGIPCSYYWFASDNESGIHWFESDVGQDYLVLYVESGT